MLFKIYFTVAFCFVLVLGFNGLQNNRVNIKPVKIESKLRLKYDLIDYLEAINRIINYSGKHKRDLDINVYFGLFLVKVNLKRALREKHGVLPQKLLTYVKETIQNTKNILDTFKQLVENNQYLRNNKHKAIFSLFVNATIWINSLPKFFVNRLNESAPLEKGNRKWIMYRKKVDDRNAWVPNPRQSDSCLTSLALAEQFQIEMSQNCKVLKSCYEMVENGTDFGYALAHRLLFLQQARFDRGCSVFSKEKDGLLRQRFCSAAYREVEYIAKHNFEIVDLLLEHVCLCGLEGYAPFLKRSWLTKILSFQMVQGCFSPCFELADCNIASGDYSPDRFCNGHTTAVAAGTLAIASRFILEFYY